MRLTRRTLLKGLVAAGSSAALAQPAQAREKVAPHPGAVGMLYDSTRCQNCGACAAACKEANGLPDDGATELSNTTKSVLKTRTLKPAAKGEPDSALVKQQCMHCVDPSCVSVCMLGALHKEGEGKRDHLNDHKGTGVVLYDADLCVGCRYCQIACAYTVPKFEWRAAAPRIVKCELCHHRADSAKGGALSLANPACAEACPAEAVVYGRRSELLAEAKRRIAAEPGRYNGKVFGENDGGGTQVLYLAAAGVTFKQMGMPDLPEESSAELSESVSHAPYLHGFTPIALYATAAFVIRRNRRKEEAAAKPAPAKEKPGKEAP